MLARNKFSSLLIDLPVGVADPLERLKRVTNATREAKFSLERHLLYAFGKWVGSLPEFVLKPLAATMAQSVSVAVSNVRGPPKLLSFCNSKTESLAAFVPPPPSVNVGLVVFSTGNQLGLTLSTDRQAIPDPDMLMDGIIREFRILQQ